MLDDRTTRAVIRDEALRLFAARGPDAVTVRQVAEAAGVSAALVMHHFGSKDVLRESVDQHVLQMFDGMLGELADETNADPGSLAKAVLRHLPPGSPVPAYLRRLLLGDGEPGRRLFRRLYDVGRAQLDTMVTAGEADSGDDPAVRAAFLLVNDLSVFLLRDRLTDVLGSDPLSTEGMTRWADEAMTIYDKGLGGTRSTP
ncbi:TetR/AcrR family transcriptional regulator [Actinomadura sp. 7K507]|uniref:TetR/AcrR family transcriptional regulator n=1 Tax=Actinomadura sp. 7K507 TaxID=2530365 RepID=UPI001FB83F70|nr:TetR/AcrR family transcriptional regulator [Actinomadura sp. 7K507]